jgi:hypothetical protein
MRIVGGPKSVRSSKNGGIMPDGFTLKKFSPAKFLRGIAWAFSTMICTEKSVTDQRM